LHDDAIAVDSDTPGTKVAFNAFLGVSPFRYQDLFEKRKRKNDAGIAQQWNEGEKRPMINVLYPSYFRAEAYVVSFLGERMAKKKPNEIDSFSVQLETSKNL
jgi:hypothetical protein